MNSCPKCYMPIDVLELTNETITYGVMDEEREIEMNSFYDEKILFSCPKCKEVLFTNDRIKAAEFISKIGGTNEKHYPLFLRKENRKSEK